MTSKTEETSTPSKTVEEVAAKATSATFAQLIRKPKRTLVFPITTVDEDGSEVTLNLKFQAISSKEYDDLIAANPPTSKQRQNGNAYNVDTFAPALIAAVSLEPKMTVEQAKEIYFSPEWATGEVGELFVSALRVCSSGLDVPFNARD